MHFGAVRFLVSESVGVLTESHTCAKMSSVTLSVVPEASMVPASFRIILPTLLGTVDMSLVVWI